MTAQQTPIHVTIADGLCRIRIDRPERKNAFTHAMYERCVEAMSEASRDASVRAIVYEGSAQLFTSGNDLQDFMSNPPTGHDSAVFRFLLSLVDADKPVVALIRGPAIGIGTTMLLHCDFALADESALFEMPFVKLGLCPEGASSLLLPELVGPAKAAELLMLSRRFGAADAERYGLITKAVAAADFERESEELLGALLAQPPASVRLAKELMRGPVREKIRATMEAEGTHFIKRLGSEEAREAFTAFFEKRKPDFSRFS